MKFPKNHSNIFDATFQEFFFWKALKTMVRIGLYNNLAVS
jgi:hypothetical protein